MRCIAIIPARYQSVRFPGKLLASLGGHSLIHHVVSRCRQVDILDEVIVATDDARIAAAAEEAGAIAVQTPTNVVSGTDRVALVADRFEAEIILNVQGDEPLLDPAELQDAVAWFQDAEADFGTLRSPLTSLEDLFDANIVKVAVGAAGQALYFSRAPIPFPRQHVEQIGARVRPGPRRSDGRRSVVTPVRGPVDRQARQQEEVLEGPFWIHIGVYLFRRRGLRRWARLSPSALEAVEGLEQLRILEAGETIQTFVVSAAAPGIDTPEDLERVRWMVEQGADSAGE